MLPLLLVLALQTAPAPVAPVDPFAPFSVYNGTWTVKALHSFGNRPDGSADDLITHCTRFTAYFACEQILNGSTSGMMIYMPSGAPGKFYTKYVTPSGLSASRGEMTIDPAHPEHFIYLDKATEGGKTTFYRVENYIKTPDSIHYVESKSTDDQATWTKTNEGDETRVSR